jgi:hypothetical protein
MRDELRYPHRAGEQESRFLRVSLIPFSFQEPSVPSVEPEPGAARSYDLETTAKLLAEVPGEKQESPVVAYKRGRQILMRRREQWRRKITSANTQDGSSIPSRLSAAPGT